MTQQVFQGVNPEEAQSEEFEDAIEQAVAEQLGVDPEDVEVTSVSTNEKVGNITMQPLPLFFLLSTTHLPTLANL